LATENAKWTDEQLKLAFYLYCQLPFGRLHSKNLQIIKLSEIINRTPSAVAMKLVNFASLDPAIQSTGRKGLGNASASDRKIWELFHDNWEKLTEECEIILNSQDYSSAEMDDKIRENYTGETKVVNVTVRIGQAFFRKSVLASYQNKCCMSNTTIPQLLIASHIVPWAVAKENRLNPSNGLCLSAIHDKAFDQGLITVAADYTILVSSELNTDDCKQIKLIRDLHGKKIILPEKFLPNKEFLQWHNQNIFKG
jgi:predicted restriction endonuclease